MSGFYKSLDIKLSLEVTFLLGRNVLRESHCTREGSYISRGQCDREKLKQDQKNWGG